MERKYRGITNAIRRAIHLKGLSGMIDPETVRQYLPENKDDAPEKTIRNSLNHLARLGEIERNGHFYYTKGTSPAPPEPVEERKIVVPKKSSDETVITGVVLDAKMVDGKLQALVQVSSFEE